MSFRFAFAVSTICLFCTNVAAKPPEAGFERLTTPNGTEVGIWYPTSGTPTKQRLGLYAQDTVIGAPTPDGRHPLVVISHGSGGDFAGHVDTAVALARAGFIVAALTHPGDNWRDSSRATQMQDRPAALSGLITYMLDSWKGHDAIDPARIGAFGFSSGGFTVVAAAGGQPDMGRVRNHCISNPSFYDCSLMKAHAPSAVSAWPGQNDTRIKAIVAAAPALGFTFNAEGLKNVTIPMQLWKADNDRVLPAPFYADSVRAALPRQPDFVSVPLAGHFDFLAPCADATRAPQLCQSDPGFDRTKFHTRFNAAVVRFFQKKLPKQKR